MHSPIISKIRCHDPNRSSSASTRNRNYLLYIATRDGVSIPPPELDNAPNEIYLKYISERPRSHGLFGNFDVSDVNKVANTLAEYTRLGKKIFHGHVSLGEQDALELGYSYANKWLQLMQSCMPEIASEFNIPIDSLRWAAAVHQEPTHPHCHFMFWDARDRVCSAFIHPSVQNRCRMHFSKFIYQEERENLILAKTATRNNILQMEKNILQDETISLCNLMPERTHTKDISDISKELIKLMNVLPRTGRLQYKLLPPDVKGQTDQVVKKLLGLPSLKKEFDNYISINTAIADSYSAGAQKKEITLTHAELDLKKRLANKVLDACKSLLPYYTAPMPAPDLPVTAAPDNIPVPDPELPENTDLLNGDDDISENEKYHIRWSQEYKKAIKYIYAPKEKQNFELARQLLSEEDSANNVLATTMLAKLYEIEEKPDIAETYYEKVYHGFKSILANSNSKMDYINYRLGKLCETGHGTEQNYEKAMAHYIAADKNKYAQYSLGNLYLRGQGITITTENKQEYFNKAMDLFYAAAQQKNPYAAYAYAFNGEASHSISTEDINCNYQVAFSGFNNMNDSQQTDDLLYKIGSMYLKGQGIPQDLSKAHEYLLKSSNFENQNAIYTLGKLYCDSYSPYYNLDQGIILLKKISQSESPLSSFAQYTLGKIYYERDDLSQDISEAIHYFSLSAKQNNEHAQYALGKLYSDQSLTCYDLNSAFTYFHASAKQGNSFAQYCLGRLFYEQEQPDIERALYYFNLSASQNNELAQYALGKLYSNKDLPFYNIKAAISYFKLAAEKNNSFAEAALGNIYLWGSHSPIINQDIELATDWLKRSIAHGNEYAQQSLDLYGHFQKSAVFSSSANLIISCFSSLAQQNQRNLLFSDKRYQSRSKENRKAIAKKLSEHSLEDS